MSEEADLPIALRRTRRESAMRNDQLAVAEVIVAVQTPPQTPSRRSMAKGKKSVRFSDPGPSTGATDDDNDVDILSTGLTPMIRRTTLRMTPKSGKPKRRHSTPAKPTSAPSFGSRPFNCPSSPLDGEVHFLPLRQVLDGRIKRRLRRNGLSEEMNTAHAEKRRRVRETQATLEALRAVVAQKDEEIRQLHEETVVFDTERVWELEQEVGRLKRLLSSRSGPRGGGDDAPDVTAGPGSPSYEWTLAARDPFADFSDDHMAVDNETIDLNDEEFGESAMADIVCGTPTRPANQSFNSMPTPPATSPTGLPMTPTSARSLFQPRSHAGVQVEFPDPRGQQLEEELASMRLEVCKLTTTLESYQAMTNRLSERLSATCPAPSDEVQEGETVDEAAISPDSNLETHMAHILTMLSDRTAALLSLTESLSNLGFAGADASEIITSLSSAFRAARLELEYLTPGEIALPLTSAGAAVLDLLLDRLRDLARHAREADDQIDEYHALELSLRQQLGARVDVAEELGTEAERLRGVVSERDGRVAELEVGLERLKGAVKGYARDVKELETLVVRLEKELGDASRSLETERAERRGERRAKEEELGLKEAAVAELEDKLAAAVTRTEEVQAHISQLELKHEVDLAAARDKSRASQAALNKTHGSALALRDARVSELRDEIDRVNGALRAAHETVRSLRVENGKLARRVDDEKRRAKEAVDSVKAELERVVRMSEGLLGTPKKAGGLTGSVSGEKPGRKVGVIGDGGGEHDAVVVVGSGLATSPASGQKSKKRRRYDSGLGFLDEEEASLG